MKYRVIDNFLDKTYFDRLVNLFTDKKSLGNFDMPWYIVSNVTGRKEEHNKDKLYFYMMNMLYDANVALSPLYNNIHPLLNKMKVNCLLRVKANLYPNTTILHEHPMHTDYPFSHSAVILSLNTCDGYTKLKDGTKIDSVANRILFFDASEEHCSTTTTNVSARFNININYIQEQIL